MYVELVRIVTSDGVPLDGAIADARGRKRAAVLFVHGLSSSMLKSRPLWSSLAKAGQRHGIGVAAFNNRGHDIMARYRKEMPRGRRSRSLLVGAGLEKFTESIFDIRAGIRFLKARGYRRVVLVGHSTGAQKIAYYGAKKRDRSVTGIVLVSPISDVAIREQELGKSFLRNIAATQRYAKRHGPLALLPPAITDGYFSAQRYLSLFEPGSAEDLFPYHNPKARWKDFRRIKASILVVIGENDEHLDRPTEEFLGAFQNHAAPKISYADIAIPNAGHSFRKHEDAFAQSVLRWIERTI